MRMGRGLSEGEVIPEVGAGAVLLARALGGFDFGIEFDDLVAECPF